MLQALLLLQQLNNTGGESPHSLEVIQMSIIVIPSVEHTGSRLLANHIFHSSTSLDLGDERTGEYCKYYAHLDDKTTPRFVELASTHPTIVPLRHPIRCAWSWEQRQKPLANYFKQWDMLIEQIDVLNPSYLRVDSDQRNDDLSIINELHDLKLETIWPYVGERSWPWVSENKPELIPLEACKLRSSSEVLKYINSNKQFFGRFYGC